MVAYFPPGLFKLARRQAQKYILSGLRREVPLSANEIQKALQAKGLGYRRQLILGDVRYWREAISKADRLKFVRHDYKPTERLYMQTGWQTKGRFETVVEVKYRDLTTGKVATQDVTVVHTRTVAGVERPALTQDMTNGEIDRAAEGMIAPYSLEGRVEIISSMKVLGFYNPDIS